MKLLLILLGAGLLMNAIAATAISNFSTGILLTFLLGIAFLLCGIGFAHLPRAVWIALLSGLVVLTVFMSGLFLYGKADTVTYTEDVVIVLGAGVHGDKPTKSLQYRLDRAASYHKQNPDALIVVSGGQGPQESVTEAFAMAQYLLRKGVPASCILKEEQAGSTAENFRFSKALLDKRFPDGYTVAFITTDYHIYRAAYTAERFGFANTTHCHSGTPWYAVLPNGLRECLAVCKYWFVR